MAGLQEAFDRIGARLEHHLESSHAAGAALAVTDGEEILGVSVRGSPTSPPDPGATETRFQIGSISKSFAAIVVLQEVEAGRLDLHVTVNEIVPWLGLPSRSAHHAASPDAHTRGSSSVTEDAPTRRARWPAARPTHRAAG